MAVNEGLYNWMLKTYGMPAAEWYRSNPGRKPGANPFLPSGAYVPLADAGSDNTYASVSPEFEEVSIIEPASSSSSDYFQQFLNSLDSAQRADIEGMSDLSAEDKASIGYDYAARQQLGFGDPLAAGEYAAAGGLYYTPNYGEYGGYLTKENPDAAQVARVREMIAMQSAGTADPSWANQNLSGLIRNTGAGGWHVRGATADDPEVQKYGIYNVGRSDYMQARRNEALQKNIEILKQQADQGVQDSQQFLDQYVAQGKEGSEAIVPPQQSQKGPRGEDFGEVAWNTPAIPQGPYTPVRNFGSKDRPSYGPSTIDTINNPGRQRVEPIRFVQENQPVDVRVARAAQQSDEQREKLTQQSEFDISKEKQLASAKAAEAYRKSAAAEDPFRAAARMG
jgi:hypothetical protein